MHYEIIAFVIVNILYTFAGTKIYDAMMKKARKNGLSKFYTKDMKKYTVEKPEYEGDEDNEALFDAIFGGDISDNR